MEFDETYNNLITIIDEQFKNSNELDEIFSFNDDFMTNENTNSNNENNNQDFNSLPLNFSNQSILSNNMNNINNNHLNFNELTSDTYNFNLSISNSNFSNNNDDVMIVEQLSPLDLSTINNTYSEQKKNQDYDNFCIENTSVTLINNCDIEKNNDFLLSFSTQTSHNENKFYQNNDNFVQNFPIFSKTNSMISENIEVKSNKQNILKNEESQSSLSISPIQQNNIKEEKDISSQLSDLSIQNSNNMNPIKNLSIIPCSILNLYQNIRNSFSEFCFIYAISAQMCQEILPMDYLIDLKIALLLSITSIQVIVAN